MYHIAFAANAITSNYIITEDKAIPETTFKGKHVGELNGMPATGKEVAVPMCVSYDLENGLIKEARIYFLFDIMVKQLNS
ncbi:MAG: hypothetical protein C4329_15555 [Chitinophagaceae bacterium]